MGDRLIKRWTKMQKIFMERKGMIPGFYFFYVNSFNNKLDLHRYNYVSASSVARLPRYFLSYGFMDYFARKIIKPRLKNCPA
jgi:hypothetical protein